MKKIANILFTLSALTFLGSCSKTLDAPTKSSLDESVIFSTPGLAKGTVTGIIQSMCETESYRGRYLVYYGTNTDVEVFNSLRTPTTDKARLSNYNTNANNTEMNKETNVWAKSYEGIERANIAIRGLRKYGNVESNPELAQILGEVLTLRAVLYGDLIKGWGDIPARFEPVTSETAYLPRTDRDIIYKQLLADLDEAAGLLAWPNETSATSSVETVNKAFAKGLRARIALYAGGYAQRMDGTIRKSTDLDLESTKMYEIAKKECLDIIESGKQRLLGFEEVFRKLNEESTAAGLESMWEIPFSEGRGRVIFDLGVKHETEDKYTGQNKGGTVGPNALMLYEYDKEDVRRDVSVVPYKWKDGIQDPSSLNALYFGKYRYEWMKRRVTSTNDDGLNWIYMRYSDILLMAAEAINELDGPGAASTYLKDVLDRAFPSNSSKVTTILADATVSKDAFFSEIRHQRALEFCGEMLRKADLIRWNMLSAQLNVAKEKLQKLEAREVYIEHNNGLPDKVFNYNQLPAKIYYKTKADGETVEIYGLNFGDTDVAGASYASNKAWKLVGDTDKDKYWDCLFTKDPNTRQYWPIWQVFLDTSNGMLNNDGINF